MLGINHDYYTIAQWYRDLAHHSSFSNAVWIASNDQGYDAFYKVFVNEIGDSKSSIKPEVITNKTTKYQDDSSVKSVVIYTFNLINVLGI